MYHSLTNPNSTAVRCSYEKIERKAERAGKALEREADSQVREVVFYLAGKAAGRDLRRAPEKAGKGEGLDSKHLCSRGTATWDSVVVEVAAAAAREVAAAAAVAAVSHLAR